MTSRLALGVAVVLAVGGCSSSAEEDQRASMNPGSDCLECHSVAANVAPPFSVAGTWSSPGVSVVIQDAAGATITLTTNSVGNFFVRSGSPVLRFPLTVSVANVAMPSAVTYGGCNLCHGGG